MVKYSLEMAFKRLTLFQNDTFSTSTEKILINSKIRPWLQFFNLGANYNYEMTKKIQVYDAGIKNCWIVSTKSKKFKNVSWSISKAISSPPNHFIYFPSIYILF